MEGSTFVSDTEVIGYINVAMAEIHDILVDRYEDYYVESKQYTLPADNPGALPLSAGSDKPFYKALGVDFNTGGTTYRLRRFSFQERNVYNSPAMVAGRVTNTLYAIQGAEIKFIPSPTVSGTATLWYVPEAQQFSTTESEYMAKTIQSKAPAVAFGYEEYVVVDAAIKCLQKEESDVQMLMVQKQQLKERIENAASNRDQGEPTAITDSRAGTFSLRRGM
tara:strand:- start:1196 stop:1858 length:663 start_codon:yes stop_codon:yes gene_type:complete